MIDTRTSATMTVTRENNVAMIEFSGGKKSNPLGMARQAELRAHLEELDADPGVHAVVMYGGDDRWFAVGGDFNEVSRVNEGVDVDELMQSFGDTLISAIGMSTPLIAAIDGWAIGFGLEVALTADYRIASSSARLKMPEFKLEVACTFGGFMLEHVAGRRVMYEMLFTSDTWNAHRSLADGLVQEVVPAENIRARAWEFAERLASWDPTPIRETKPYLNEEYLRKMHQVIENSKKAHGETFRVGTTAQEQMNYVLNKNHA